MQLQQSMGLAIEVKVHKLNEAAINECFNNMFGAGSWLTTMQLEMGYIIEFVRVYGVVVSMDDPDHSVLLSLDIDFSSCTCYFRCVEKTYPFIPLTNCVLSHLVN